MNELSWIAPILLVIWVILIGMRVGAYLDNRAKKNGPKAVEIPQKVCPLHAWKWMEQPGIEPITYYMWCQRCGKTPRQVSEGN
jgi:hypothetical protein